jgi:hypothetical protein
MDRENYDDELDRIIDCGLAGYAAHEPLAGLEDRVLNRVRLANAGRRRLHWRPWAVALPIVVALVVLAIMSKSSRPPVAHPQPVAVARTEIRALAAAPSLTRAAAKRRIVSHTQTLPKRNQFPTPTPITAAERALIAVAELPPLEKSSEEIQIAPIEIPPLQIDGK